MTVSTSESVIQYDGNDATVAFPVPFRFLASGDLVVTKTTADGLDHVLVMGTDYSVAGAGALNGGTVTMATAPASAERLTISREMIPLQETDLRNQGKYLAQTHENVFDYLTMLIQQNAGGLRQVIRVSATDPDPARLPNAAFRANMLMGFNSSGDPVPVAPVSGSASDLALQLLNTADPSKGAAMVGALTDSGGPSNVAAVLDTLRNASYARRNAENLRAAYKRMRIDQLPVTIVCQGDSVTGGYDITSPDVIPGPDGVTRAPITYPGSMQYLLRLFTGVDHVVINRGWSGDTAPAGRDRWTTDPAADVAHIMYGLNDAASASGTAFEDYIGAIETLIRRHIDWGCGVVLHTATLPGYGVTDPDSSKFSQALRTLAETYGCPIFESDTAVRYSTFSSVYSDWVHFNSHGYQKYGNAVGAFVLSGAWVQEPKMVSGDLFLHAGTGYEGVGFIHAGTTLGGDWGTSYVETGAGGQLTAAGDRRSFVFFMDCEFMNVHGIGSFEGLDVELSYGTPPTYVGDTRANGSPNRFPVRSSFNRELRETTGYRVQPGRAGSSGRMQHMGLLVGRGWKTVSVSAPAGFTGTGYFQGLLLQEASIDEAGRQNVAGTVESLVFGQSTIMIWQYPFIAFNDSSSPPAAASLPSNVYLPAPDAVMPSVSGATGFYDSLPVEVDIQGSGAGEWAKVFLRRTASGNTLTVESIATGASGAALVPTAAEVMYKVFDPNTRDLIGGYISGFGSGQDNTFIRLGFGATSAGYYKILMRDSSKPGRASLI